MGINSWKKPVMCLCLAAACLLGSATYAGLREDILFHASFENTTNAISAAGERVAIKTPANVMYGSGIVGMCLTAKKPYVVQYPAKDNISREKGTLAFWYYIDEWNAFDKEYYNMFHIEGGQGGYTYLYRSAQTGGEVAILSSLVRMPDRKPFSQRIDFPMVEAKKWHLIAVTWEGKKVSIYVDGMLVGQSDNYVFPLDWKKFGFQLSHPGRRLDEATVYGRPLSDLEIKSLFYQQGSLHTDQLISIAKTDTPIKVDGSVTDEEWGKQASFSGLYNSQNGQLTEPGSQISLCYDDKFLYVAFETGIPEKVLANIPAELLHGLLKKTAYKHDEDVERDDAVSIHIVPDLDKRDWYRFVVNGVNTHYEYVVRNKRAELRWDPAWKTASTMDLDGWHVEIAIPLDEIKAARRVGTVWGINFLRYWRLLKDELQLWSWGTRDRNTRNRKFSKYHDTDPSGGSLGKIRFAGHGNINVRVISMGKLNGGNMDFVADLVNTHKTAGKMVIVTLKSDSGEINEVKTLEIPAGETKRFVAKKDINQSSLLNFTVVDAKDETVYFRSQTPFFIKQSLETHISYFPGFDQLNLSLDLRPLAKIPLDQIEVKVAISRKDRQKPALIKHFKQPASYQPEYTIDVRSLATGEYDVRIQLRKKAGEGVKEIGRSFSKKPLPEWYGNKLGISDKVPSPFEPLRVDTKNDTVSCWGRRYEFKGRIFPEQVFTQGNAILREGMELRLVDTNGNTHVTEGTACSVRWKKVSDVRAEWERSVDMGPFRVMANAWIEYDGFLWTHLRVEPRGKEGIKRLELNIPYKKEWARLINVADYSTVGMGKVKPEGWRGAAARPLWLGNAVGGMQWTNETAVDYRLKNAESALRVIPKKDHVLFRVTFIDREVKAREPFEAEFGLVATPTRPRTPDYRHLNTKDTIVQISFGLWQAYSYICDPSRIRDDNWSGFVRVPKSAGLPARAAFYSPAPYSSTYSMATETDEFKYWGAEWSNKKNFVYVPNANQDPKERTALVCQAVKSWQDFYVWSYWKLYQKKRYRGIYHDDGICICGNTQHGCGRDDHGVVQPTRTVLGKREINKRLYTMLREQERDKTDEGYPELRGRTYIIQHHSGHLDMAWASFCDYYADGENFTGRLSLKDQDYHRIYPPDRFRAQSMGHNFGPACWFLDEFHPAGINQRDGTGWNTFEPVYHLFGLILLHDSTYWFAWAPQSSYQPYIRALRYCNWGDQYRMIPYWSQKVVKLADKQYATFYVDDKAKRVIMIFLNNNERGGIFNRTLDWKQLGFGSWKNLKLKNVHPVPTRKVGGKLEVRLDAWEKRWKTEPNAWIKNGKLKFSYGGACSRFIVLEAGQSGARQ